MNDWVVETPSFEEDLMNNRMVMLNQNGVNKVVKIIKEKDKEIESFKKYFRIVNTIELYCLNSIYEINDILNTEKITKFSKNGICLNRNKYQIERLKAYRTKSKEILKLIRRLENTYYGKEV